jgi:hypothetical protein
MQFNKFKYLILAAVILLAVSSCQKVIDLKLDSAATQLVIEGNITNMRGPQYVTISQSVPFTNTNIFPPVSGARVTINDDKGNVYSLTESTTTPGTYMTANMSGRPDYTYTLTVQVNGKTYTGSSTMPEPVFFNTLSYANDSFRKGSQLVTVNFQDPVGIPNQYRFVMYVNSVQVKTVFVSNDEFTDGSSVEINLYQNDFTIVKGDTVVVEDQGIDKNIFNYWYSLSQQQDNGAGGGTTPSNPPSNLSNNALGYFSAHTSVFQGVVIQ